MRAARSRRRTTRVRGGGRPGRLPDRGVGWRAALLGLLSVVAVSGLGGLQGVIHSLLVPHGICEHGLPVHLHGGHTPSSDAGSATEGARQVGKPPAARPSSAEGWRHEHCTSYALPLGTVQIAWTPPICVVVPWLAAAEPRPRGDCAAPIGLLLLAPKHSPPRIAPRSST